MRRVYTSLLIAGLLGLALVVGGCAPGSAGQPTAVPPTSAPAATTVPATVAPTVTAVAVATATAAPQPTAVPPTSAPVATATAVPQPTAVPPTAEPIAELHANEPWVRSGPAIFAVGAKTQVLDLPGIPPLSHSPVAAPSGAYLAYVGEQSQLVVLDRSGAVKVLIEGQTNTPVGFSFSPDSGALAFTLIEGERWRLQVLDLTSGDTRTLEEGAAYPQSDGTRSLVPRPIAWNQAGILVERLMWATEAPPEGLFLVDPADGASRSLPVERYLRAAASDDGARIAVVTGTLPIGETPTMAISTLDPATGELTPIVPERQGLVKGLRWSPDGARLLYAAAETYETPVTSVYVLGADGSGEQRVDFGTPGFAYAFRDLAWRGTETALVLAALDDQRLELHELSIHAFDQTGLKRVGEIGGVQPNSWQDQIVYVPREL